MNRSSLTAEGRLDDTVLTYRWQADDGEHQLGLARVAGTEGTPFLFGGGPKRRPIEIRDVYMGSTPVTQAVWQHLMGSNPSRRVVARARVERVSWNERSGPAGVLARSKSCPARVALAPACSDACGRQRRDRLAGEPARRVSDRRQRARIRLRAVMTAARRELRGRFALP